MHIRSLRESGAIGLLGRHDCERLDSASQRCPQVCRPEAPLRPRNCSSGRRGGLREEAQGGAGMRGDQNLIGNTLIGGSRQDLDKQSTGPPKLHHLGTPAQMCHSIWCFPTMTTEDPSEIISPEEGSPRTDCDEKAQFEDLPGAKRES